KPTENVVMRNCSSHRGHGGLVVGSEMSGDVRNVYMHDCEFDGTDRAVRIKSQRGRGGVVEKVWAENITVKSMQREVVILNMDYGSDPHQASNAKPPLFRNIRIKNVTGNGAPTGILITGLEDSPIQDIQFENITVTSTKGIVASNVKDLSFIGIKVTPSKGPVYDLTNASQIKIQKAEAPKGIAAFLKIDGKNSGGIRIEASDLSGAKQAF